MAPTFPNPTPGPSQDDKRYMLFISSSEVARHFSTSGIAVAIATGATHPLDVVKVRLQMECIGQRGALTGMANMFVHLAKNEGPRTLYSGLVPALVRSIVYGGLRLGLYEPCKYVSSSTFGSTNIMTKVASGAISGSVATALSNPADVLKVRLQMQNKSGSRGPIHEMFEIVTTEGVAGLWKGVGPAMARAAALTASQLATYDESKQALMRWTSLQGFFLHLSASTIAGIFGTAVTAPMDTVKTRLMMQRQSLKDGIYKNGFHCAYKIMLTEGPQALYKGSNMQEKFYNKSKWRITSFLLPQWRLTSSQIQMSMANLLILHCRGPQHCLQDWVPKPQLSSLFMRRCVKLLELRLCDIWKSSRYGSMSLWMLYQTLFNNSISEICTI